MPLPNKIDPLILARNQQNLLGDISADNLPRLHDFIDGEASTHAHLNIYFTLSEQGFPHIVGQINILLQRTCQRCLQPMSLPLKIDTDVMIVSSESLAKRLARHQDYCVNHEKLMPLGEWVEDEILLAMPIVSYHQEKNGQSCHRTAMDHYASIKPAEPELTMRSKPFSALHTLKQTLSAKNLKKQ